MITHLHIQNFKCLRDVQIDLAPFTILIGPNDSGKSSLLDAVSLFGMMASTAQSQYNGSFQDLIWRKDTRLLIHWMPGGGLSRTNMHMRWTCPLYGAVMAEKLAWDGQVLLEVDPKQDPPAIRLPQHSYIQMHAPNGQIALSSVAQMTRDDPRFGQVIQSLLSTSKYSFDPAALRHPSAVAPNPLLTPSGENLPTVMDAISTGPDRSAIIDLERVLHEEIPTLRGSPYPPHPTV